MSKRYPRRFTSDSKGCYVEVASEGELGHVVLPDGRKSPLGWATEAKLEEDRVETFDHHEPQEPNNNPELDKLRAELENKSYLSDFREKEVVLLAEQLAEAKAEVGRLTKENEILASRDQANKKVFVNANNRINQLCKERDELREQLGLANDSIRVKHNIASDKQQLLDRCKARIDELHQEVNELRAKLAESESERMRIIGVAKKKEEDLEQRLAESEASNAAMLSFLHSELGWADFRADTIASSASEENANKLREFLKDRPHGGELLDQLAESEAAAAKMREENAKLREENEYLATDLNQARSELAKSIDEIDTIGQRLTLPPQSTVERILEEIEYVREKARASKVMLITDEQNYDAFVQSRKAQPNLLPNQSDTDMLHGVVGIVTESGELLDALKKQHFYGRELNRTNVIEELGDLEFYLSLCRTTLGVSRREVIDANVRKLELRYKERFTREESENRDTKAEAKAIDNALQPAAVDSEWPEVWSDMDSQCRIAFRENQSLSNCTCGVRWSREEIENLPNWKLISKGGKAVE